MKMSVSRPTLQGDFIRKWIICVIYVQDVMGEVGMDQCPQGPVVLQLVLLKQIYISMCPLKSVLIRNVIKKKCDLIFY